MRDDCLLKTKPIRDSLRIVQFLQGSARTDPLKKVIIHLFHARAGPAAARSMCSLAADDWFEGRLRIIFCELAFSAMSFLSVMELPFLKFMKYITTVKSCRAKAVKNDWSWHVVDIRYNLFTSLLLCLSLNFIVCVAWCSFLFRFQIWKSSF